MFTDLPGFWRVSLLLGLSRRRLGVAAIGFPRVAHNIESAEERITRSSTSELVNRP
jgi:hypothetical protein